MTDDMLPDPLVAAEVDLRDFAFMPLDVVRLRDSDLAAEETPETCWAALLLWAASWHQVPAGSIPDSNAWQAKHAGYVARGRIDEAWEKTRAGALRNWVMCSDGRLYHPVIAEKAVTAWDEKLAQRARTKAATEAREAKKRERELSERDEQRHVVDDSTLRSDGNQRNVNESSTSRSVNGARNATSRSPRESNGTGRVKGQGQGTIPLSAGGAARPPRPLRKCPPTFLVESDLKAWGRQNHPGVDLRAETEKFRDHTFKTAISDWPATWRNWIRKAAEFQGAHPGAASQQSAADRLAETQRLLGIKPTPDQETIDG